MSSGESRCCQHLRSCGRESSSSLLAVKPRLGFKNEDIFAVAQQQIAADKNYSTVLVACLVVRPYKHELVIVGTCPRVVSIFVSIRNDDGAGCSPTVN